MTLWTEICDLVLRDRVARLADRLVALTEEERAELGGRLPGLVKELRRVRIEEMFGDRADDSAEVAWEIGELLDGRADALLLAGVGVITGPAAAVTWMTSRDVNRRWAGDIDVAQACRVAASRPLEWRREVAVRLARRIRRPADRIAPLAVALLRESGAAPPDHDPLVAAWLAEPHVVYDPLTPLLLPRVFDAEGAGRALRDERLEPRPTRWLAAATRELPRERVLDGCVSRFLRGGDTQDLRFFVRLHTLADPTPAETASRLRDYLRLLPSAPGTVAELAAGQVRAAMPLDHADLVEAIEALTFREEAKLAAIGLRWLDQAVRAAPESAADFVTALTTAYAHKSFDVRDRAVKVTLKHAGLLGEHAEVILDGIRDLPAHLGVKLAERLGGEIPVEELLERKVFPPLPEPRKPQRFPEPSISAGYGEDWVGQESWLAAFVAGAAADRAGLRRRLQPHAEQNEGYWRSREVRYDVDDWRSALSAELINPGSVPEVPPFGPEKFWDESSHSVRVRVLTRGEEPEPEPSKRRITVGGVYRPGRYLDDDAPLRAFFITWNTDDGPGGAVAREGDQEIPFARGRIHLNGSPADDENEENVQYEQDDPRSVRSRPGVVYDDSEEAMPYHILDRAYERMAELGVDPARIAAMRAGEQVPPPGPDEPLVQVTVAFVPSRLRSFLRKALPEQDEWRRRNHLPHPRRVSPPHDFLLHRYAELAEALRNDTLPPVLLATPTWMSGHLDPDVLVDRLETCAAAGVEPPPADLAQALLRLPRGAHRAAADRAAKVDSEAARSAARWLAGGGMADPECGLVWRHMVDASMVEFGDGEPEHFTSVRLKPVLRVTAPTGHRLIDEVLLSEPHDWAADFKGTPRAWPAMLPSHREVVAVNLLPYLLHGHWSVGVTSTDVTGLDIAQGPMGEPMAVILAFLLSGDASGMIPLVLDMAARGELPAEAIGRQLALVLRRTWREIRPTVAALGELAAAGGHREVWRILRELLPELLPGQGKRTTVTHTELVAFAADVAGWTDARGEIPIIAEYAGSTRTNRFAHECRRLHTQLTG
ncbi:hypothetical protein DP939_35145 [Spongiactinospora rosea]|uniref:DUF7824 domain-containing protein n=1 Tax=Spongiactinospora rosea TaxID=2248750 RepID=A0A366LPP0_9ACTN|nr:DUF6493 family protein [Spongiactinospora rosea]RBQ15610.1 hypothetical protein DP939_35145 [Spongiactinospora rosea]